MSKALEGENYCIKHQGNHSHYAEHNCTVCKLERELADCKDKLMMLSGVVNLTLKSVVFLDDDSDSLKVRLEEAIDATTETVAKHKAEIEAKAIESVITAHPSISVYTDVLWLRDSILSMAAEKRGCIKTPPRSESEMAVVVASDVDGYV